MDVSIIVLAYNEEKYIQPLLKTLKEIQGEAEVLVVREFLQRLDRDKWLVGYGIEVTLTRLAKRHNLRVASIPLSNVTHPIKEEKLGIVRGFTARMKMYWEITKELSRI